MVSHIKIFLFCSFITMQNLVTVSHTMCIHVGGPKIWGWWGFVPLGCGVVDLERRPPPHGALQNLVILDQIV